MRTITIASLLIMASSLSTFATNNTNIKCNWVESETHADDFFRPASIQFSYQSLVPKAQIKFTEDTFLFRTYSPCWTGGFSSCAFGFSYEGSTWTILENTHNQKISMEAPGFYWDAELEFNFSKKLSDLKRGQVFAATLSGDDGDGVFFSDEKFICQKF